MATAITPEIASGKVPPLGSEKRTTNIINNNPYKFNVSLITADGRYQELRIGAINSLVIEDTFTNFYHKGYIILNNTFDALERIVEMEKPRDQSSGNSANSVSKQKGFLMRGDSRDLLVVDIMPIFDDDKDSVDTSMNDEDANKAFLISIVFSIYNTEEVIGSSPGQKFKKLYFWDMHYELLREKNSYFSTAKSFKEGTLVTSLDDSERALYTGDAIKEFLLDFFKEEDGWPIKIDEEHFDQGSTKVFFSAPARFKGIDCLEYLTNRHTSSIKNNFDQAFLNIERNTSLFSFKSLADVYKTALNNISNNNVVLGSSYLETFKLGAYSETSNTEETMTLERVDFTPAGALFFDKYGTINNFSYDPLPGEITQHNIAPVLVHSYDHDCKQFNIDFERNSMQSTLSTFKENYVDTFKKASKTFNNVYENVFPGEYRLKNKNVRNVFTIINDPDQRLSQGRNKVLYNSIFMNSTITFKVPGSTHRQAGHFIGLNFDGASNSSEFNKKLLGVYFLINVKHIFEGNEYFNEIRAVKTYNYEDLLLNKESR